MGAIAAIAKSFFDAYEGRKGLCGLHGVVQAPMPLSRFRLSLLSKFVRLKRTPNRRMISNGGSFCPVFSSRKALHVKRSRASRGLWWWGSGPQRPGPANYLSCGFWIVCSTRQSVSSPPGSTAVSAFSRSDAVS